MSPNLQGHALAVLSRVARAHWPDRLGLRSALEKLLYGTTRLGFRVVARRASRAPGPAGASELFDLALSDEQRMLVEVLEAFSQEALRPAAQEADARGRVPAGLLNQAHGLGLAHYGVGEELGGLAVEGTLVTNALMAEALAKGDLSLAASLLVPLSVANCIRRWGSARQRAAWLPAFVAEQPAPRIALAVSEPAVLFDPCRLATRARRKGGHYVLNGEKCLVLDGLDASRLILAAATDSGPALFMVDVGSKGLAIRQDPAMGLKACGLARIRLKDVKVPVDDRLVSPGFDYRAFLDLGHLAWCALAVGTAQAALEYAVGYCNERTAFGEPISHRQGVAFLLADMAIEVDAMRLMVWRACARADRGEAFHRDAYLARLLCAEKAMKIGTDAVQLLGGHGFTQEHPVERWYRDLRAIALISGGLQL